MKCMQPSRLAFIALASTLFLVSCSRTQSPEVSATDEAPAIARAPGALLADPSLPQSIPDILLPTPAHEPQVMLQATGNFPPRVGRAPASLSFTAFTGSETQPSDTFVVNDQDSNTIDRYLFRDGPEPQITIPINIRRYVGPTDGEGYLQDVEKLVEDGIVSREATVYMPIFDVDANTSPVFDCDGDGINDQLENEQDALFFNGESPEDKPYLTGQNNIWQLNQFTVDISQVKFPSEPGGIGQNEITIDIDVGNRDLVLSSGQVGCRVWAVEVDWVAIEFEAMSPVVFVHGIRGTGQDWIDNGFKAFFEDRNIVVDARISLSESSVLFPPLTCERDANGNFTDSFNDSTGRHVNELRDYLTTIAEEYGTNSVHLISYSKGGIDSRAFIADIEEQSLHITVNEMGGAQVTQPLEVLSLTTISTPHSGSAFADAGLSLRQQAVSATTFFRVRPLVNFFSARDFLCPLSTDVAEQVNISTPSPWYLQTFAIGTDADANNNLVIEGNEGEGYDFGITLFDFLFDIDSDTLFKTKLYRFMGRVQSVEVTSSLGGLVVTSAPTLANDFLDNDLFVTVDSALSWPKAERLQDIQQIDSYNHRTVVIDSRIKEAIYEEALSQGGSLDWRLR